jgi:hypothetical protein
MARFVMVVGPLLTGLLAVSSTAGCASKSRPALTDAELTARSDADAAEMRTTLRDAVTKTIERVDRESALNSEGPVIHFLAMSGGGDNGAFGAGFLVGWGQVRDPEWARPDFDAVTGVSTGALLAPFAYVGTDETYLQVDDFYRNPKKDWIRERGMLFFLPKNASFSTIPGLERDIRDAIDGEFITQMAERSRQGKIMAISATDLDLGRQRFWEVGAESQAAVQNGDFDRVQRILLASAAIPAVFPPVQIGDSLYGDGGVSANIFLRLDARSPEAFIPRWREAYPGRPLPKVRYWIIINNQAQHIPNTVQAHWPKVIGPSLSTAIRSATLAEVRWLTAEANYINTLYGGDIEVRVVAIPSEWRPPVAGGFKKETMESLSDLGRRMGADPSSWTLWTTPIDKALGGAP